MPLHSPYTTSAVFLAQLFHLVDPAHSTPAPPPPCGPAGQGKTFQCSLAYKKLGIAPIVMSAGELESGNAGEPAKLIRQRYREASDVIRKGKMCSLFINDLDAGAGRMGGSTQYTVNNQMVNATLMNIADNPTNVQLPGVYKTETIPRVPVVCTGEHRTVEMNAARPHLGRFSYPAMQLWHLAAALPLVVTLWVSASTVPSHALANYMRLTAALRC